MVVAETHRPDPELFSCLMTKVELATQLDKLSHVLELQSHLMNHFSFPHPTLLLGNISSGSVVINWHFPVVETERTSSIAVSSSVFYKEHNIVQVMINDRLVYGDTRTVTAPGQQEVGKHYSSLAYEFPISWLALHFTHTGKASQK